MLKDYNACHLDHPRHEGSKFQLLRNLYRLHNVENMTTPDLREYIMTWTRFDQRP